jgi:hypothetical protein
MRMPKGASGSAAPHRFLSARDVGLPRPWSRTGLAGVVPNVRTAWPITAKRWGTQPASLSERTIASATEFEDQMGVRPTHSSEATPRRRQSNQRQRWGQPVGSWITRTARNVPKTRKVRRRSGSYTRLEVPDGQAVAMSERCAIGAYIQEDIMLKVKNFIPQASRTVAGVSSARHAFRLVLAGLIAAASLIIALTSPAGASPVFNLVPGAPMATDVAVGANGTAWAISTVPNIPVPGAGIQGGNTILKRLSNGSWTTEPGGATEGPGPVRSDAGGWW